MDAKLVQTNSLRDMWAIWLKGTMDDRGLTQSGLARKSGVSRETIWRILNSKSDAGLATITALSGALDTVPPTMVVGPDGSSMMTERGVNQVAVAMASFEPDHHRTGWLFHGTNPEEAFNSMMGYPTIWRWMAGRDGAPDADVRQVRLGLCRMAVAACERAGRAVPDFVNRSHNEIIEGTYDRNYDQAIAEDGPTVTAIESGSRHGDSSKQVGQSESTGDEEAEPDDSAESVG